MQSASRQALMPIFDSVGDVKSMSSVRIVGAGHSGAWTVRVRYKDGRELFYLPNGKAPYTAAQASAFINNNRSGDPASGDKDFIELPAGAKVQS